MLEAGFGSWHMVIAPGACLTQSDKKAPAAEGGGGLCPAPLNPLASYTDAHIS